MSTVDILVTTYNLYAETEIGAESKYASTPHPGTNNKIEGWKWDSMLWPQEYSPVVDLVSSGYTNTINRSFYQSGIGSFDDCEVRGLEKVYSFETSGIKHEKWVPVINHGWFYLQDEEWYLYSDSHQSEIINSTNTVSGMSYIDLKYQPKPCIPIQVRSFQYDFKRGRYQPYETYQKVLEFTSSGNKEFIVDDSQSPPRIQLDQSCITTIGEQDDINTWERLGNITASGNLFYLEHSPVDLTSPIFITSVDVSGVNTNFNVVSGFDQTLSGTNDVFVDSDLGLVNFKFDQPSSGLAIYAMYSSTVAVTYEPINTTNIVKAESGDIYPIKTAIYGGFIQLTSSTQDVGRLELSCDFDKKNGIYYARTSQGAIVTVKVFNKDSVPIIGQQVNIEILKNPFISAFPHSINWWEDSQNYGRSYFNERLGTGTYNREHQTSHGVTDANGEFSDRLYTPMTLWTQCADPDTLDEREAIDSLQAYVSDRKTGIVYYSNVIKISNRYLENFTDGDII